jgi:signal peptidase II
MTKGKFINMLIGLGFIVLGVAIDQITKLIALNSLKGKGTVKVIDNFFYLTYAENTGGAWSIFSGKMWIFYIITMIALGMFVYMLKDFNLKDNTFYSISMILIITGTLGNFIDRVFRRAVIDFLDFNIFSYKDFPIFNVADICLTVGVAVLLLDILFGKSAHLLK